MIVNRSVLREQDLDFINAQIRKEPKRIVLRVIALLLGLFYLFTAFLEMLKLFKWKTGGVSDVLLLILFCILAYLLLSRAIFLKQVSRRTSKKYQSLFAPRTYTVDAEGIAASHSFEGVETQNRFAFANADCFFSREDAVVLRFRGEKKMQYYMCLRDDGYTEGTREELLALLREKGIRGVQ